MKVRNCAWNAGTPKASIRPVWVRKRVVSESCPKSIISAHSLSMLEQFHYWKASGGGSLLHEEAKLADALLFLNEQWMKERGDGEIKE